MATLEERKAAIEARLEERGGLVRHHRKEAAE